MSSMRFAFIAAVAIATACKGGSHAPSASRAPVASPWPEADALFHRDPRWLGGDVAYSIDLGSERVLWLFGDTFVATSAAHVRRESVMVRNSIAIQTGYDPSRATIAFHWGTKGAAPSETFASAAESWFWPAHGAMVEGRLVVFLSRIVRASDPLGFRADGWTAVRIDDPAADPASWTPIAIATPPSTFGVTFGASAIARAGYLYVYGAEDTSHAVHLVRYPATSVARADLSQPEWWSASGWVAHASLASAPPALFADGATELSVQRDPRGAGWVELQTVGFGAATLELRASPDLVGPWGALGAIYTPPESHRAGALVYAGKGHEELRGADLVATYSSNASDVATLVADETLYYPRFVRVDFAAR
jgi:hypothetical protein